jgi:CheY-like chemotaxis protein
MNFAPGATGGEEGIALFRRVRALDPELPILLMTAWTSLETAVQLVKEGATDYLAKPWNDAKLVATRCGRGAVLASADEPAQTAPPRPRSARTTCAARSTERRCALSLAVQWPPTCRSSITGPTVRQGEDRGDHPRGSRARDPAGARQRGRSPTS